MNRLFQIELEAQGTPEVESFASYIYRSAYEHAISVGKLIHFTRTAVEGGKVKRRKGYQYLKVDELIRPGERVSKVVHGMEKLTGEQLNKGVLWFLGGERAMYRHDIIEGFRWCPECFQEMEKHGDALYYKLIWHLSCIRSCPIHRTPFLDRCQFCGDPQTGYARCYPLGICNHCGRSLLVRKKKLKPPYVVDTWSLSSLDIIQLFDDIGNYPCIEINLDLAKESLRYISRYRREEFINLKVYKELFFADTCSRILCKDAPISMYVIRRISYAMGISLFDFLSGNASKYPYNFASIVEKNSHPYFMNIHPRKKIDHKAVREKIIKLNKEEESPLSLKEMARKVDVSVGYLEYRYPDMVKKIVKRHKEYAENIMLEKRNKAQAAALRYFTDEKYANAIQSRKQAYKVLREETGLPKFILQKAIRTVYQAMY